MNIVNLQRYSELHPDMTIKELVEKDAIIITDKEQEED